MEEGVVERVYTIPLRREWMKVPCWQRAKKAVKAIRKFVARHVKAKIVKIDNELNKYIWSRGAKHPPHKVRVRVVKKDDIAEVYLMGEK